MSLPGAGKTEPTILEVLNRNTLQSEIQQSALPVVTDQIQLDETKSEQDPTNVLEIESHLIETFENFSVSEVSDASGVAIREVPPAKEELAKSSQIDSETSPKTIIEIEPSVPKVLKQIELELVLDNKKLEPQLAVSTNTGNAVVAEHCDKSVQDEETPNIDAATETATTANLTSHIEKPASGSGVRHLSDPDIGRGINGLQNCTTPLEEAEKQKLLDSLPQLDENDSNRLSIQAKQEYYQLLRDYLDKQDEDRPPVPLKTYRWEDLKRAKEKVFIYFLNYYSYL